MNVRTILHATDLSGASEQALDHAIAWARRFEARLRVLHVVTPREGGPADPEAAVARALAARGVDDLDVDVATVVGDAAAPGIVADAADTGADWIVVGTHGRRGFRALLLGSVAEETLRTAPCPVLVVRPDAPAPGVGLRRMVVPLDFSEVSLPATRVAREVAGATGAAIVLVHVIEDALVPDVYVTALPSLDLSDPALEARSMERLEEIWAEAGGPDVPHESVVLRGRAGLDLAPFAAEREADLVVLPSRGRSTVERLLYGGTADKVVRRAPCPVLVLRGAALEPSPG